jgi:hypothetical protein
LREDCGHVAEDCGVEERFKEKKNDYFNLI